MAFVGTLGLLAGLILAAILTAAGVAKLSDGAGTRTAVREFGAPERLVGLIAIALPLAELTVALLLLPTWTRGLGAVGALGLLGLFSGAIAVSLAQGRSPECHCFGRLHSSPVSWRTLARNGILAGFATLALAAAIVGESVSAVAWLGALTGMQITTLALSIALVVLAAAGTLAFLVLLRSYGRALVRLDGIERRLADAGIEVEDDESPPELGHEPGTPAPAFVTGDVRGELVSLDDLLAPGLPLMLLFTSPTCGPCEALLPQIAAWQDEHAGRLTIAIADSGERNASLAKAEEHGLEHVLVDDGLAIHDSYGAGGTPSAVLVAPDGQISSYVAPGADWIERLLERVIAESSDSEEQGLPVGSPAPDLSLVTLDGTPLSFASTTEERLLLFWNPSCGFCASMRDDLLRWERQPPLHAPRLVVVSSGDEASTRAEGFSSTVALDPELAAAAVFEADGTPMAVLLDREGRIASPLAAGAEAVFALAGGRGRADASRLDQAMELVLP